jgi:hypothetical protein
MLFNSYEFLVIFLPLVVAAFYLLGRLGSLTVALLWLVVASLLFHAYWKASYTWLFVGSMAVNYLFGLAFRHVRSAIARKGLVTAGIVFNLALLGYFKYAGFLSDLMSDLLSVEWNFGTIVLPLAISFYTFQQIAFVVDCYRNECPHYTPLQYVSYLAFFPHLIAGPIVRHNDLVGQLSRKSILEPRLQNLVCGLSIVLIGLFKKVIFADGAAAYANPIFAAAHAGAHLTFLEAWLGALAFAFVIYFDFSGYSDMDRPGPAVQRQAARELRLAIQGGERHRVLAALACDIVEFSARISLYPARRQPAWAGAPWRQCPCHDAAGRLVARGGLEFHHLGRLARFLSDRRPSLAPGQGQAGFAKHRSRGSDRRTRLDVPGRCRRMGVLSQREHARCDFDARKHDRTARDLAARPNAGRVAGRPAFAIRRRRHVRGAGAECGPAVVARCSPGGLRTRRLCRLDVHRHDVTEHTADYAAVAARALRSLQTGDGHGSHPRLATQSAACGGNRDVGVLRHDANRERTVVHLFPVLASMVVTLPTRPAAKPSVDVRANIAGWLPLLLLPFAFGATVKIFPIDTSLALTVIGLSTIVLIAFDALVGMPQLGRMLATAALLLLVLSLPFWCMESDRITPPPPRPIYSYRDAKADPHAFYRWWAFFVGEVGKTNAIVLARDPTGIGRPVPVPGARAPFYRGEIVINNRGYRGDDIPDAKGDTFRIVTIGDSTTFGQMVFPESRPWSARLQDIIRSRLRCERPIQVINGAVNAWLLKQGVDRIETDMAWLAPDMVLPYFAWDLELLDLRSSWIPARRTGALDLPPADRSRLQTIAWFIEKAVVDFRTGLAAKLAEMLPVEPRNRGETLAEVRKSPIYHDYERLIQLGRRHGFRIVLLSVNTAITPDAPRDAVTFYEGGFPHARQRVTLARILNWTLEDLARKHPDAILLDTSEGLLGRFDEDLFLDIVHFTPAGDARMAENVFNGLRPILAADATLKCTRLLARSEGLLANHSLE